MIQEYKVFATFNNNQTILHSYFELLPDRYISVNGQEACPVEDYGDWMLFENPKITEEEAFETFINIIYPIPIER